MTGWYRVGPAVRLVLAVFLGAAGVIFSVLYINDKISGPAQRVPSLQLNAQENAPGPGAPANQDAADAISDNALPKSGTEGETPDATETAMLADEAAWKTASEAATIESLRSYLEDHRQGQYAAQAIAEIAAIEGAAQAAKLADETAWNEASEAGKIEGLRKYLEDHRQGQYAARARAEIAALEEAGQAAKLADEAAWNEVSEAGKIEGLRKYLEEHPQGQYIVQARQELALLEEATRAALRADTLAWDEAAQKGTIKDLQDYADTYPLGQHVTQAKEKIAELKAGQAGKRADKAAWKKASQKGTIKGLRNYLDAYPEGSYAPRAKTKIAKLKELEVAKRADKAAWKKASKKGTIEGLKNYVEKYPQGQYVTRAKTKITKLEEEVRRQNPLQAVLDGSDKTPLRDKIKRFIKEHYLSGKDLSDRQIGFLYADRIDYFGEKQVSRDNVIRDKKNYFQRWPSRRFSLIPGTMSVKPRDSDSKTVDVSFRFMFKVSSPERTSRGLGKATLTLQLGAGNSRIIREERIVTAQF